jgi:ABC-2 type transport system permease protein
LALLGLSISRQLRGRRLAILGLLFSAPLLFALLARRYRVPYDATETEGILIFGLIPQGLLPLAALLFASGMVQDEVEEQTLTYILMRPVPRWLIYLTKLLGTWLVTWGLATLFTTASLAAVYWGDDLAVERLVARAAIFSAIFALGLFSYTSLFGALGLLLRRSLILGVAYIVIFEGLVANIDFIVRRATVMYYVRTLAIRWLALPSVDWTIEPAAAPSVATCLMTLLGTGTVLAMIGAWIFSRLEFRLKTPGGG